MKVKILGAHNSESRNTRYMSLLVDRLIALDAGSLTSALSFRDQTRIKAVLLTHGHYDHIRDIPAFAMNLYLREKSVDLYTHQAAHDNLRKYFLDGGIYPEFDQRPPENPTLKMHVLEADKPVMIEGYQVTPVAVSHSIPAVGYQISSAEGRTIFYTGDTGRGLAPVWRRISPQVLFIEVTASNRWEESVKNNGHLTPNLLNEELKQFREIKGYLPRVVTVHINPESERDIRTEIAALAESLKADIEIAHEGMIVEI